MCMCLCMHMYMCTCMCMYLCMRMCMMSQIFPHLGILPCISDPSRILHVGAFIVKATSMMLSSTY